MKAKTKTVARDRVKALITNAEELPDPHKSMTTTDPANAARDLSIEEIKQLEKIKAHDPGKYAVIVKKLKQAGRTMPDEESASDDDATNAKKKPSQIDILLELCPKEGLFHTPDDRACIDWTINSHRETMPIPSHRFNRWLRYQYQVRAGRAPSTEALNTVEKTLEAIALHGGPERRLFLRVASHQGKCYVDLADEDWRVVEIDDRGWRVVDQAPIRFYRSAGMEALPVPRRGGSVNLLRPLINLDDDQDFTLVVAWLVAALRDDGPYPVLAIAGEQGSAKSTCAHILRDLVDPNQVPLRNLTHSERDLFISAHNAHLLAYDNVTSINSGMSDVLCRLATGGGFATRRLYTDEDEALFAACRPIIINGINQVVRRSDLADRTLMISLRQIPAKDRRTAEAIRNELHARRPLILGALFDVMSVGLRRQPEIDLEEQPRMADFARWAVACEPGHDQPGTFLHAYQYNRNEVVETTLELDPVASAVRLLMADRDEWSGHWADCWNALNELALKCAGRVQLPSTHQGLSQHLSRLTPYLRECGIEYTRYRDKSKTSARGARFARLPATDASAVSARQEECDKSLQNSELGLSLELNPADTDAPADLADPLLSARKTINNNSI